MMMDRLPTRAEFRVLDALTRGQRARRVPREYVGRMPARFVRQRCVTPQIMTAMISAKWLDDVSTAAQRDDGEAIYLVSAHGRGAHALALRLQ